jgi:predicted phage terminase large subunit-like protein
MLIDPTTDRAALIFALEKALCEQDLYEFVKAAWPHIDPAPFTEAWHIREICRLLQLVSQGDVKRLVINIPPGHAKTITVAVMWLAWNWVHNPAHKIIYATYAQNLSLSAARKHRDLIRSDWFQERWGKGTETNVFLPDDQAQKQAEFENNRGGGRLSVGRGGEATGRRGNLIVVDDLAKAQDSTDEIRSSTKYLTETLSTRGVLTDNPKDKTAYVAICQRLHEDDVAGWAIRNGWLHLCLPLEAERVSRCFIFRMPDGSYQSCQGDTDAQNLLSQGGKIFFADDRPDGELLAPQLLSIEQVRAMKEALGPGASSAQLQQRPQPPGGLILDPALYGRWENWQWDEIMNSPGETIISVDPSLKNHGKADYAVAQLWRVVSLGDDKRPQFFLMDMRRGRWDMWQTIGQIEQLIAAYEGPKTVVIEDAANGTAILQTFRKAMDGKGGITFRPFKPHTSKESRAEAIVPVLSTGRIHIPKDPKFPGIDVLIDETRALSAGRNDDAIDALIQCVLWYELTHGNVAQRMEGIVRGMMNRWW